MGASVILEYHYGVLYFGFLIIIRILLFEVFFWGVSLFSEALTSKLSCQGSYTRAYIGLKINYRLV